jgi:zinc transporter ZupT
MTFCKSIPFQDPAVCTKGSPTKLDMPITETGGDTEALSSWRLWVVPLAAGIFAGAAAFEVLPFAVRRIGPAAVAWALGGLLVFVAIHKGLDALGHHGAAGASTLGMWLHAFLEGVVTATGYGVSTTLGVLLSLGLVAHLIPEATALVALLRRSGLSVRSSVARGALSWLLVATGFLLVRYFLPLLPPPVLGAGMAFGAGGILYLAAVSWMARQATLAGSLAALATGAALMGLVRAVA